MNATLRSLRHPNYRLYFGGALVSNVGTWMSRIAQDWLVLTVLTDNSPVALGVVTALQFLPMLLLAPYGGVLADQFSKRRLLVFTQMGMAACGLALAVLTATGEIRLWHVYAIAFVFGMVTAIDNPARQAFVSELVPTEDIPNAVGLNSASFNAARLLGPGSAGLLVAAVGIGPVFFINTLTFVAVLIALWRMDPALLTPSERAARGRGQLRAGIAYIRRQPTIMLLLGVVFLFGTFCMNTQVTNALMATTVFHRGSAAYGLLGTIMAVGSLSAALLAARRTKPSMPILVIALLGFGVSSLIGGLAPNYTVYAISMVPLGLSALTVMTTANAAVQLAADPTMRGRVMALYMAVFMGGTPIGSPMIGWIAQTVGTRASVLAGAVVAVVTAIGATIVLVRRSAHTLSELPALLHRHPDPEHEDDEPSATVPTTTRAA